MKPVVSIIVPNYNHAAFLKERLDSVFNQSFQDFELILLDDASSDDSAVLLKSYAYHPKVTHVVLNDVNSGSPFRQWQRGIDLAAGEFIWIAESDDYCEPNFLESCLEALSRDVGMAYVQSTDVDANGQELASRLDFTANFEPNIWTSVFTKPGFDFIAQYLLVKNVIPNASAVVFRKDFVNPDYFSPQLLTMQMCGDWFFWIQLLQHRQITFIDKKLNYFRHHQLTSRNHDSLDKKKTRLLEEKTIRDFVFKHMGLRQLDAERHMMRTWFKLHTKTSMFKTNFLRGKLACATTFGFFKDYITYKVNPNKY